jgi:preprotein translocase subunit SecF
MRFFKKTNIDFMAKRRIGYTISGVLIGAGIVSLSLKGFDFGVDFLGGTELIVQFSRPAPIGDIRSALERVGFGRAEIKAYGSDRDILIRTTAITTTEGVAVGERLRDGLKTAFPDNPFTALKEDKIGPKIGAELRRDAIYAVIASLLAISLYVAVRFKFVYGVGAIVSLLHDVLVTLGLVSICDGFLNLEIDQNMIAAFLTLVGTSINDTVVIFDRIRENQKIFKTMPLYELMNKSINETLSRTIITNGSIFMVLLVILLFGGEVLRGFAFALTIGSVTGTYSTVYIASAVVLEVTQRTKAKAVMAK